MEFTVPANNGTTPEVQIELQNLWSISQNFISRPCQGLLTQWHASLNDMVKNKIAYFTAVYYGLFFYVFIINNSRFDLNRKNGTSS